MQMTQASAAVLFRFAGNRLEASGTKRETFRLDLFMMDGGGYVTVAVAEGTTVVMPESYVNHGIEV
jgi:hypothetical protein